MKKAFKRKISVGLEYKTPQPWVKPVSSRASEARLKYELEALDKRNAERNET